MKMKERRNSSVDDYFSNDKTKFTALLKSTKKWKEIYNQSEAKLALLFSVIITIVLYIVYYNSLFEDYIQLLKNMTQLAIETSIGMLGFIISGLAIFTGTITAKLIKNIDSDQKIDAIIGVLFSFYFIGAIIGISIGVYLVVHILLTSKYQFMEYKLILTSILCSYLFFYNIFYSISLLGTCIRLFFVSYKYSDENK